MRIEHARATKTASQQRKLSEQPLSTVTFPAGDILGEVAATRLIRLDGSDVWTSDDYYSYGIISDDGTATLVAGRWSAENGHRVEIERVNLATGAVDNHHTLGGSDYTLAFWNSNTAVMIGGTLLFEATLNTYEDVVVVQPLGNDRASYPDQALLRSISSPDTCIRHGDTNCDGNVRIAVIGDSYISGEGAASGAQPYRPGTDHHSTTRPSDVNLCHRTEQSWAVQVARFMAPNAPVVDFVDGVGQDTPDGDAIVFTACSGARTQDLNGDQPQFPNEGTTQLTQLEASAPEDFDAIFVSIGGNDAGFGDVAAHCLASRCVADNAWKERVLGDLESVGNSVTELVTGVRELAPQAEVYQVGYPDPFLPNPTDCGSITGVRDVAIGASGALSMLTNYLGPLPMVGGRIAIRSQGDLKVDASERAWISSQFLPALNGRLAASAQLLMGPKVGGIWKTVCYD